MINKRAFSLLNLVILVCCLLLGSIAFKSYYRKSPVVTQLPTPEEQAVKNSDVDRKFLENQVSVSENQAENKTEAISVSKASPLPDPKTLPTISAKTFNQEVPEISTEPTHNGYFENKLYAYIIDFPKDWTLKSEQLDNVSIGKIPPKDGIGVINIRIGGEVEAEIAQLKKEMQKYAGMVSLLEDTSSVGGKDAKRLIITNLLNNTKSYYLIFSNNSIGYIIKFTYESESFYKLVSEVLENFKFTNK